jgi:hypothetical protein
MDVSCGCIYVISHYISSFCTMCKECTNINKHEISLIVDTELLGPIIYLRMLSVAVILQYAAEETHVFGMTNTQQGGGWVSSAPC